MKKILALFTITTTFIFSCSQKKPDWINNIPPNPTEQNRLDKHQLRKNLWHISGIIGQDIENDQEFIISKIDTTDQHSMYGTSIKFNINNTYEDSYHAKCGNDCFPSSKGNYILKDENHIAIKAKEFHQSGDCDAKSILLNTDYVTYYIFQTSDGNLKLIKSNGNPKEDKQNQYYSTLFDKYYEELINTQLDFKTKSKSNEKRVEEFLEDKAHLKNYKILYTRKQDDLFLINLVKNMDVKNDYYFVINGFINNYDYQVGAFKVKNL